MFSGIKVELFTALNDVPFIWKCFNFQVTEYQKKMTRNSICRSCSWVWSDSNIKWHQDFHVLSHYTDRWLLLSLTMQTDNKTSVWHRTSVTTWNVFECGFDLSFYSVDYSWYEKSSWQHESCALVLTVLAHM